MAIASTTRECLRRFEDLKHTGVEDENGRFRVWAGNISAHRTGRRSLEYRLRDASNLRDTVISFLRDLIGLLEQLSTLASQSDLQVSSGMDDDDAEIYELDEPDASVSSLRDQALDEAHDVITCLLRFSSTLRNPANHDQLRQAAATTTKHFEPHDVNHVRDKFPNAASFLHRRMGKAISKQRQYFKYREEHHLKLAEGIDEARDEKGDVSTVATSIVLPNRNTTDPEPEPDLRDETDSIYTATSFAPTVADNLVLRLPALPEAGQNGEPFECPLCYGIVVAEDERSWRQHIYEDLPPYVCIFDQCGSADHRYNRRRDWFRHLRSHAQHWLCPFGCPERSTSRSDFQEHLVTSHSQTEDSPALDRLTDACATEHELTDLSCPLCKEDTPTIKRWYKHLGHHLEQCALHALPQHVLSAASDDESQAADDSDDASIDNAITDFKRDANIALNNIRSRTIADLKVLIKRGTDFQVDIDELDSLVAVVARLEWDDMAKEMRLNLASGPQDRTPTDIANLVEEGKAINVPDTNPDMLFFREHMTQAVLERRALQEQEQSAVEQLSTHIHDRGLPGPRIDPNVHPVEGLNADDEKARTERLRKFRERLRKFRERYTAEPDPADAAIAARNQASSQYACDSGCGMLFDTRSEMIHHARYHKVSEAEFQCLPCGQAFVFRKDLVRHEGSKKHRRRVAESPSSTSRSANLASSVYPDRRQDAPDLGDHALAHERKGAGGVETSRGDFLSSAPTEEDVEKAALTGTIIETQAPIVSTEDVPESAASATPSQLPKPEAVRSRHLTNTDEWSMWHFENHAATCRSCFDPYNGVFQKGKRLCSQGVALAEDVALNAFYDGDIYATRKASGSGSASERLEIKPGYRHVLGLLRSMDYHLQRGAKMKQRVSAPTSEVKRYRSGKGDRDATVLVEPGRPRPERGTSRRGRDQTTRAQKTVVLETEARKEMDGPLPSPQGGTQKPRVHGERGPLYAAEMARPEREQRYRVEVREPPSSSAGQQQEGRRRRQPGLRDRYE